MDSHMNAPSACCCPCSDHGNEPFCTSIVRSAHQNRNFRTAIWTGCHLQMTLMCIPPRGEIGAEIHPDTDQIIRVESGQATVYLGTGPESLRPHRRLRTGDAVFIPCGTWHNILNCGGCALRVSSVYGPPQHPFGTVHRTKADSDHAEH